MSLGIGQLSLWGLPAGMSLTKAVANGVGVPGLHVETDLLCLPQPVQLCHQHILVPLQKVDLVHKATEVADLRNTSGRDAGRCADGRCELLATRLWTRGNQEQVSHIKRSL